MAASATHADFQKLYGRELEPLDLAKVQFRFFLTGTDLVSDPAQMRALKEARGVKHHVPKVTERMEITDFLESVEWRDEGNQYNLNTIPVLRGTANYHKPDPDLNGPKVTLRDGHKISCHVLWGGRWKPYWEMRIMQPPEVTVETGEATFEMADDLWLASKSLGNFTYKAGKHKKKAGWLYHEIVIDICKKYRIPCGTLVKGTYRIKNLSLEDVSPLEVIRQAVLAEQNWTGKEMVIAWRPKNENADPWSVVFGITVRHIGRNRTLFSMREEIRAATSSPVRRALVATSIDATGTTKKKKGKRKKFHIRTESPEAIRRYGYITRHINVGGNVKSAADVRRRAKAELAKQLKPVRALSNFTHSGIPFVWRGDTVRVRIPEEGYVGQSGVMFVTSVIHSLTGTDYTMTLELFWRDPLDPARLRAVREAAARRRKRAKKGKKK